MAKYQATLMRLRCDLCGLEQRVILHGESRSAEFASVAAAVSAGWCSYAQGLYADRHACGRCRPRCQADVETLVALQAMCHPGRLAARELAEIKRIPLREEASLG